MIKETEIRSRLEQFNKLSEKEKYKEFLFCLLTPQSNAQRCWQAVEELSKLQSLKNEKVNKILSTKTRFHHTKTKRILQAKVTWEKIKPLLSHKNSLELRNRIAREVNGYGLKEAAHFLRNIGLSNNSIAILDRHILKNLYSLGLLEEPKIKSPKHYLEVEQIFLAHAQRLNIEPDILDLHWWSEENGEIFK